MTTSHLEERVVRAAHSALAEHGYLSTIDVLLRLGWLAATHVDIWRQGRIECLEEMIQAGPAKQLTALRTLRRWVDEQGLTPHETSYVARTRDRRRLRFSVSGAPETELAYRTHWVAADLSDRAAERLRARTSRPPDLVVVAALKEWTCAGCGTTEEGLLLMHDDEPHCMRCVELDHLVFLPAGDAGRTRRAHRASTLTAVVVRFSRTRKRYERQGLLVEPHALDEETAGMGDVTIWHNPRCSKSRGALALLTERGVAPGVRRYLDDPPTRAELEQVLRALGTDDPRAIVRTGERLYRELGLADADRDTVLDALAEHPALIERPIVIRDGRAVVGRPPERVTELLEPG